ncbi:MAG TPA: cell surface protein [Candidatus Merdenecus merdavium]|nr:cell surface protein [Candidatus Merdenecus merdavium]
MKYKKRYLLLPVILLAVVFYNQRDRVIIEEIAESHTAVEDSEEETALIETNQWRSLNAGTIDEESLTVTLNGEPLKMEHNQIYISDSLEIMGTPDTIADAFWCILRREKNGNLVFEKNNTEVQISLQENELIVDNQTIPLDQSMDTVDQQLFLSMEEVGKALGYEVWLDLHGNGIKLEHEAPEPRLPALYDYRTTGRKPKLKNQGKLGTCWAVAASSAIESTLLPEEELDVSADHMSLSNSFRLGQNEGGGYTISMAYLTAWQGPVYEKDDPYGDGYSPEGLEPVKHVQEIQIIEKGNLEDIKWAIYQYGAVQSAMYMDLDFLNSDSIYYNHQAKAYAYTGDQVQNHDIIIIGWDDTYAASNFSQPVEGDGAFICQNSWGEEFGEGGVFYISYYDTGIGEYNVAYTKIEDTDNYDHIYQADLCGYTGQVGYEKESAYFSNVYESQSEEELKAVGFYTVGNDSDYEIYVVENFEGESSLKEAKFLQKGWISKGGYYTIDLEEPIQVSKGQRFAMVIKIRTSEVGYPIAIEYPSEEALTDQIDTSDGEGYISENGELWMRAEEMYDCNICLKVYTDTVSME